MPKRVQNCNDIDTPFIHVTLTQDLPQLPLPPQSSSCLHTLHTTSTRPTPHPHVVHTTPNHNIFTKKHERLSIVFHKIAAIQRPSIARHTRRTTAYSQTTLSNNRVGSARNPRPQVCALLPDRSSDGRTCTLQPRTTLISSANPPSTLQLYPPPRPIPICRLRHQCTGCIHSPFISPFGFTITPALSAQTQTIPQR